MGTRTLWCSVLLLGGLGCTGGIGDIGDNSSIRPAPSVDEALGVTELRRLNAREYRNSVEDYFGIELPATLFLPADSFNGEGFDTDGSELTMTGAAVHYYNAAASIAELVSAGAGVARFEECQGLAGEALWACFEPDLRPWLSGLFRRPASDLAVESLMEIGSSLDLDYGSGIETLVTFALTSPDFLMHYKTAVGGDLDDFELASRLAYLLWSSTPDEELLSLAASQTLREPDVLEAQVDRLLADEKSDRFIADFTHQWSQVDALDAREDLSAEFLGELKTETLLFLADALRNDPLAEVLAADWTYVNQNLAAHYEMATDGLTEEFERRTLAPERQGMLMQASGLAAHSPEGLSDPIRRGFWSTHRVVCNPPPDINAPDVPPLDRENPEQTVREILEEHRLNPVCAGCHDFTDPYGLALEVFDVDGAYRTTYENGRDVDAAGELPSGEAFADVLELNEILIDRGDVQRCLNRFLTGYALNRGLSDGDLSIASEELEAYLVARRLDIADVRLRDVIVRIVTSPLFRTEGESQ